MTKKEIFRIKDMVCRRCEKALENAISGLDGIKYVKAEYETGKLTVEYDTSRCTRELICETVEKTGYQMKKDKGKGSAFGKAALLILIIGVFCLFRMEGLTGVFSSFPEITEGMGYSALFLTGLLTSVHCIAMCGGLNLAQSLQAGKGGAFCPTLLYNLGRLTSYTLIGGLLGGLGGVFSISVRVRAMIGLFAGVFMMLMAFNMLNLVPFLRRIRLQFPKVVKNRFPCGGKGGSFSIGLLNGLMPCGPLQSMQLLAIAEASVLRGALSMFFFCLGTIPLMLFFGAAASALKKKWREKMLAAGAVLILLFSLYMIQNNAALLGYNTSDHNTQGTVAQIKDGIQYVTTILQPGSYEAIEVKQGIPVEWMIVASEDSLNGCNREILIPEYGIDIELNEGDNIIEFFPRKEGTYSYSCWMGMIRSSIYITE